MPRISFLAGSEAATTNVDFSRAKGESNDIEATTVVYEMSTNPLEGEHTDMDATRDGD